MRKGILGVAALAVLLGACGGASQDEAATTAANTADGASAAPAFAGEAAAAADTGTTGEAASGPDGTQGDGSADATAVILDRNGQPVAELPFDIGTVPITDATLGDLPVLAMPAGYGPVNRPAERAFARFPFRLGDGVHWVEGASWNSLIGVVRDQQRDKQFSALELRRNLEAVLAQAGAHKVFEGPLQRDIYYGPQLEEEIGSGFIEGVNLDAGMPTTVYVIRQADRTVWVQLSIGSSRAAMVVVDARPFQPSARWTGGFPWLALPAGYDGNRPRQRDYDMYPFWTGSDFEEVEGRAHISAVRSERRAYSMHEVRRSLEAMMAEAGGALVFHGRIPKEASDRHGADLKSAYSGGTGHSWNGYESMVYRVDLPDARQVWVHARLEAMSSGWVVVEREGFAQTAALLPASVLKQQLDAEGRVVVQVNFAVDKADILPDSRPQLDQVLALLRDDPSLRLSIDGHTDATGDVAHNQRLSEARAKRVVATLTTQGIEAARLEAKGLGQSKPVAGNDTDEGRAMNRRVELVRL